MAHNLPHAYGARRVTAAGVLPAMSFPDGVVHVIGGIAAVTIDRPDEYDPSLVQIWMHFPSNQNLQIVAGKYDGTKTVVADAAGDFMTAATHGFTTGDGPYEFTTTVALPGGVLASTPYWLYVIDGNTFQLCESFPNATNQSKADMGGPVDKPIVIDITGIGTGVHTIESGFPTLPVANALTHDAHPLELGGGPGGDTFQVTFTAPTRMTVLPSSAAVHAQIWWT